MEDGELADLVCLHEWEEAASLEVCVNEGLTKVIAIFEELEYTSVLIYKHTDHRALFKPSESWLLIDLYVVIVLPSSLGEDISSLKIDAP